MRVLESNPIPGGHKPNYLVIWFDARDTAPEQLYMRNNYTEFVFLFLFGVKVWVLGEYLNGRMIRDSVTN